MLRFSRNPCPAVRNAIIAISQLFDKHLSHDHLPILGRGIQLRILDLPFDRRAAWADIGLLPFHLLCCSDASPHLTLLFLCVPVVLLNAFGLVSDFDLFLADTGMEIVTRLIDGGPDPGELGVEVLNLRHGVFSRLPGQSHQ
jgi:hypothetical protein